VFEVLRNSIGRLQEPGFEMATMDIRDEDVTKALEEMRERAAAFAPVEGRAIQDGDFAQVKLLGTPEGGGDRCKPTRALPYWRGRDDGAVQHELEGGDAGEHKNFDVEYPADYRIQRWQKKYHYAVEVLGIKTKKLPK